MDIEVKVDKEAVERAVSAAIVQSAIGDKITTIANELVRDAMAVGGYGKPDGVLRQVVETEMVSICRKVFLEEYTEKVTAAVRELVTDDIVNSIVAKAWGDWLNKRDRW